MLFNASIKWNTTLFIDPLTIPIEYYRCLSRKHRFFMQTCGGVYFFRVVNKIRVFVLASTVNDLIPYNVVDFPRKIYKFSGLKDESMRYYVISNSWIQLRRYWITVDLRFDLKGLLEFSTQTFGSLSCAVASNESRSSNLILWIRSILFLISSTSFFYDVHEI